MRTWLWIAPVLFFSVTGCSGGEEPDSDETVQGLPSTLDLAGTEIKTKNWAVMQSFRLYDLTGNNEADIAGGEVQLVGGSFDDPCYLVANNGEPPEGEAGEWVHVRATIDDLPLDGWPEGETYLADGDGRFVRLVAYKVDANGGTLFDAGGPFDEGSVTLEGNDQFGPVLTIETTLGFIRQGVVNTPVEPAQVLTFNIGGADVEVCPEPEQ